MLAARRFGQRLLVVALCGTALGLSSAPAVSADSTVGKSNVKPALAALLPPIAKACYPLTKSYIIPGLVGISDAIFCNVPKLGSKSELYAYLFDNASDYQTSLAAYDSYKGITPPTPGVQCPTNVVGDNGVNAWSNRTFPKRVGQILECKIEGDAQGNADIPDYIWTVPTKNVILEVFSNPGSSMQRLDTWWLNNADTGTLLHHK